MGGKMLKKSFFLLTLFVFFSVNFSFAQSNSDSVNNQSASIDINDATLSTPENLIPYGDDSGSGSDSFDGDSSGTTWEVIKVILMLALIVAVIYGISYFFKNTFKKKNDEDPFLRQVSKVTLSPGKSVQIVTLLDKAYIIGVTDDNINLLGEVEDKELIASMNLYSDKNENVTKPKTFADILNIFMPDNNKKQGGVFSSNRENSSDFLKKQRNRLNGEE